MHDYDRDSRYDRHDVTMITTTATTAMMPHDQSRST